MSDVYIEGSVIVDVRPQTDIHRGWKVWSGAGLTLTPGFIDVHSHSDNAPFLPYDDITKLAQGVTTEVVGNCGLSLAPSPGAFEFGDTVEPLFPNVHNSRRRFADVFLETDRLGYVTNSVPLAGHGAVRTTAMGLTARLPSAAELRRMEGLLDESLAAGCFGLSTGLIYPPGCYADTEELIALARRLPPPGVYATHLRSESVGLLRAVNEALRIGELANARVQLSHHKAAGVMYHGMTKETLTLIRQARGRGTRVYQDVYPYIAGSTELAACLPPIFREGGSQATLARLKEPGARVQLRALLESDSADFENFYRLAGPDAILISSTLSHLNEGRTLAQIARETHVEPTDALIDVLIGEQLQASMIVELMDEADVCRVLLDDHTVIGSDSAIPGHGGLPHPRTFGTFPRVLARYVRDQKVLTLEGAIRKMTGLPAEIFSLCERGRVAPGNAADLVAFDAAAVTDDLNYRDPVRKPRGLAWVMLAGEILVRNGRYAGGRRGVRLQPVFTERTQRPRQTPSSRSRRTS